jgi:hypothetical protein
VEQTSIKKKKVQLEGQTPSKHPKLKQELATTNMDPNNRGGSKFLLGPNLFLSNSLVIRFTQFKCEEMIIPTPTNNILDN